MEVKINNKIINIDKDTDQISVGDSSLDIARGRSLHFIDTIDLLYFCSKVMNNKDLKDNLYKLKQSDKIVRKEDIKELQKVSSGLVDTVHAIDTLIAQIAEIYEWSMAD